MSMSHERGGIRFDPTVNLGHILTFLGFVVTLATGWATLDKRIVILEENRHAQAQRDIHQDERASQNMQQIQQTLGKIDRSVEKLSDRIQK